MVDTGRNHGQTVIWRPSNWPGLERSTISSLTDADKLLEGTAIGVENATPFEVRYRVLCDARWLTKRAELCLIRGNATTLDMVIEANVTHQWFVGGEEIPDVEGCLDIDLGFSPVTNTLPIERLGLEVGESAPVRATWVRFPDFTIEPLDQRYTRLDDRTYRYESATGFVTQIEMDAFGMVENYHGGWQRCWQ